MSRKFDKGGSPTYNSYREMGMKKPLILVILSLFLATVLSAQSLAELSKKEKERREALKGKRSLVITNADLGKTRKKAGLETSTAPPQAVIAGESSPQTEPVVVTPPAEGETVEPVQTGEAEPNPPPESAESQKANLESSYARAKEYADLLELKMGALWQEFYSLDDTTPRDSIQREIALTFEKLEKAREAENQAKKALEDYLAGVGRANAPPIWIR